jgi:hypothetical protein
MIVYARVRLLSLLRMALLAALAGPSAVAQSAPPQDFSGVWQKESAASPPWAPGTNRQFAAEMPLQPWAKEYCEMVGCGRGVNSSGAPGGGSYLVVHDPAFAISRCAPYGFPRVMIGGGLMEIFHVRDRVFMRFQTNNEVRYVWTDGRAHPEELEPTWMGHSVGRWDGDTLAVDTVGILGGERGKLKWLDPAGTPHSDALHITERIGRTAQNKLQIDMTFEDSEAFTAPFSGRVTYGLRPDEQIFEYIRCENRIFSDDKKEVWPLIFGDPYPMPLHPPAGTAR